MLGLIVVAATCLVLSSLFQASADSQASGDAPGGKELIDNAMLSGCRIARDSATSPIQAMVIGEDLLQQRPSINPANSLRKYSYITNHDFQPLTGTAKL